MTASKDKKRKKSRVKKGPLVILAIVCIAAIAGTVTLLAYNKPEEKTIGINIQSVGGQVQSVQDESRSESASVSIDMENCSIKVGTVLMATATVTPVESENALAWSSSNNSIFTVDNQGIITVTGIGTAALTATIGDMSDAVIIEGIANTEGAKSQLNFPSYEDLSETGNTGLQEDGNTGNGSQDVTTAVTETLPAVTLPVATTQAVTSKGAKSTDLYSILPGIGYDQRMSNVYTYENGSHYYGEIIIQPNLAIIYIMQRNSEYDSAVQSVIKELLPDEHSQVWSNYTSATTDRTFTAEGRTIRIVTASSGGHSQIVIYN